MQKRIRELSEKTDVEALQTELRALQLEKESHERVNADLLAQLDAKNCRIVDLQRQFDDMTDKLRSFSS